jgi:hypothetical protein
MAKKNRSLAIPQQEPTLPFEFVAGPTSAMLTIAAVSGSSRQRQLRPMNGRRKLRPQRLKLLRFVRRLPMSAGREARAGACGQALNKPEGRKPRGAPMQGGLSGYGD